jgi:hypothetical protein
MSDPETFLSRWSRRKREVGRETTAVVVPPETTEDRPADNDHTPVEGSPGSARPSPILTFDPASLPSIQSITAQTDIRGFLASGVPAELTRAALRRAWACDPAIRNFVGLAEYDWDFNAADSIAGFGPLQANDEVRKMAAQIVAPEPSEQGTGHLAGSAPTSAKAEQVIGNADLGAGHDAADEMHDRAKLERERTNEIGTPPRPHELTHREHGSGETQHPAAKPDSRSVVVSRQHGGALPK